MAEAEKVSELVRQQRLQIVGFWICRQCLGSRVRSTRIARIEINVCVENLPQLCCKSATADLNSKAVCRNHSGESQHAGRKGHVRLIETDGIHAIRATSILRRSTRQRTECCGNHSRAVHAGPCRQ